MHSNNIADPSVMVGFSASKNIADLISIRVGNSSVLG